jgi:LPS export ABC transporter protein LptC
VFILALLILWPTLSKIETEPLTVRDIEALRDAETQNQLLNPTFNTTDSQGRLVTIKAQEATQAKSSSDRIFLNAPSAQMNTGDDALQFQADQGVYDQSTKIIQLNNNVTIKDADHNILTTDGLTANIDAGTATSNTPAKITAQQGTIEGQSVIIDHTAQTTTFKGPAKAVINP